MRRLSFVAVLCVSLGVVAVAVAAPGVGGLAARLLAGPRLVVDRAAVSGCSVGSGAVRWGVGVGRVVLGGRRVGSVVGESPAGVAKAFVLRGQAAGRVVSIKVYLASGSRARKVMVALYSGSGCQPGSRLTGGSLARPRAGAWNAVAVRPASIQAGRMYWLVVLGSRGVLVYRELGTNGCSAGGSVRGLDALPALWSGGGQSGGCGISAFALGASPTVVHGTRGTGASGGSGGPTLTSSSNGAGGAESGGSGAGVGLLNGAPDLLPPTAAFTVSSNPTIGQPVTFDGSGSACTIGPCTYAWDNDGAEPPSGEQPLGSGQVLRYTFSGSSGFTAYVRLTVTDALGQAGTVEHDVYVAAPAPAAPVSSSPPSISGVAEVGDGLTASPGAWSGSPSYAYQWSDCGSGGGSCAAISGATSATYTVQSSDVGHTIEVSVTASNAGGSATATSAPTATVTSGSGGSSCTQTVSSASALSGAVSSAVGGSTICVAAGSYGAMSWSGGGSRSSQVTVEPVSGAAVVFTGTLTEDASYVRVLDIDMGGQLWEVDGPTSNVTMDGVTAGHFRILSSASGGASNISILGGSYGPNYSYPDNTIGSNASPVNTNILIDGVLFHDQVNTVSGAHFECLQVWDANGLTIENSKFTNCSYFDLFIQHVAGCPGSGNCPATPTNITIQNNWFDCCVTAINSSSPGTFNSANETYSKNFGVMFPTDHGEGTWSNVVFRNNSGDAALDLGTNRSDAQSWSNFRVENNALPAVEDWQASCSNCVPSGVSEQYNAWFEGSATVANGSGHDLGTTNPATIFENWDGGYNKDGKQDFHELNGSPTARAGDPNYYPPTDIDGNTRTSPPDIGASQTG